MSMQDPISDMLTRIANAQRVSHKTVSMPSSKIKIEIARVLQEEGYIIEYDVSDDKTKPQLTLTLKRYQSRPVIEKLKRVSRPGLRIYRGHKDIPKIGGGYGVAIVSTSRGVMSDRAARKLKVGGEVLLTVY